MIVSEARIAANRRNAKRSTGPKTVEGKEKSRANALKHGLCASVIVHEDALQVQTRTDEFFKTLRPQNNLHCWLVTEIAVLSVRIDRCERIERRIRDKMAIRAELFWDDDRRLDAMLLGATLGNRPDVVAEQLRKTTHGCEWLMTRWAMLAHSADVNRQWTPAQTHLAFDLLGTPAEFREGNKPGASLDFRGRVVETADDLAAVARREIDLLEERRELCSVLDEANRALAEADLTEDNDPELRRLRRYESTQHGRLRWCLNQLRYQSPLEAPYPGLRTTWLGKNEPRIEAEVLSTPPPLPLPEPKAAEPAWDGWLKPLHPPFDLELHEVPAPGEPYDVPMILGNRRKEEIKKSDANRNARRRKLEKLRA